MNWITDDHLPIANPEKTKINIKYNQFIWIETLDSTHKIVFSEGAIQPIIEVINDAVEHVNIFGKLLQIKKVR